MAQQLTYVILDPPIDEIIKVYQKTPEIARPFLLKAMERSVLLIAGQLRIEGYPPSTEANRPGRTKILVSKVRHIERAVPLGYYERGRGYWYPILLSQNLKGPFGKSRGVVKLTRLQRRQSKVVGYKLRAGGQSEILGKKWNTQVNEMENGVEGRVGTSVSYAQFVQGDLQADFHKRRGWITIAEAIENSVPGMREAFSQASQEVLAEVARRSSSSK